MKSYTLPLYLFCLLICCLVRIGYSKNIEQVSIVENEDLVVEEDILDVLAKRSALYFLEQADEVTGLVPDRAKADGRESGKFASMAATGFGLTAICIADERGWITTDDAKARVEKTLRFALYEMYNNHGFFYHFVDKRNGKRDGNCELSSIDTALFIAGVLTAGQYYKGTAIESLANQLYERIDWNWMLNGERTLSMGWTPESGFLVERWDWYCEHMLLYLLAIGSPTHSIDREIWQEWRRDPIGIFDEKTYLQCPPLFTHQFSQAWVDFRNTRDAHADYWKNSVLATLAQREFCASLSDEFSTYSLNLWGITASDGPDGYKPWGGPPATIDPPIDGSIVPCAAAGSLPFAPKLCKETLQYMKDNYGETIWNRYGFADAFNPITGWVGEDVLGIDVGITLLMIENAEDGFVWKYFMKNKDIQVSMKRAGFIDTTFEVDETDREYLMQLARETWHSIESMVNEKTGLPYDNSKKTPQTSVSNIGVYLTDIVGAYEMKLISQKDATKRIEKALTSLSKLKTWHGFQQSWNSVETLLPDTNDVWISILDSGNLVGGLITVGQAFPTFEKQCTQIVATMDWGAFYNKDTRMLCGGYNTVKEEFNWKWNLPFIGSDSRMASFISIASESVPADSWNALDRYTEERHHAHFLKPGWINGGGIFEQYLPGLWLDEKDTMMGQSAANFAYAQIRQAQLGNYPVWGWSASDSPEDGYLGMGALVDNVVTPHASVLAIRDYPQEVLKNLRALDALGARSKEFGYVDAIDFRTGKCTENFLMLDQSMLFISLCNFLKADVIRQHFESSPIVNRGRQLINDYREPAYGENNSVLNLRELPVKVVQNKLRTAIANRISEDKPLWQDMNDENSLESRVPVDSSAQLSGRFMFAWNDDVLRFCIEVRDETVVNSRAAQELYEEDCVELFIDPHSDGLVWGSDADFQFGFAVDNKAWEWFGTRGLKIISKTELTKDGYLVTADIPWTVLGIKPEVGLKIGISPAIRSIGEVPGELIKLNWSWFTKTGRVELGTLELK